MHWTGKRHQAMTTRKCIQSKLTTDVWLGIIIQQLTVASCSWEWDSGKKYCGFTK